MLTFFFAIAYQFTFSQDNNYAVKQLKEALQEYETSYNNLLENRGIIDSPVDISDNYIIRLLEVYGMKSQRYSEKLGVLYYHVGDKILQIWLIRSTEILSFNEIDITKNDLTELNNKLRSALKVDFIRGAAALNEDINEGLNTSLKEVLDVLLPGDIPEQLKSLEHLVIIPEFNIGQFPFYILKPFNDEKYLIDILSISVAPSMMDQEKFIDFFSNNYIGLPLNFVFENPLIVGNPSYTNQSVYHFDDLKGAEEEAQFVADLGGCKALTGTDARISSVKIKAKDSDFIYFATHAMADFSNPLDSSFIVFTPDETDSLGFWTAREIQQAEIGAEMVVLSACQTGLGKSHEGGVIGLSRAFFIAGVYHTIMSLWSVNDEATKELMKLYIRNLQDPFANMEEPFTYYPAEQLRQAILEYKEIDPDPAHWAPFMVFGYPF